MFPSFSLSKFRPFFSALEGISGFATAPGVAGFVAITPSDGTNQIRAFSQARAYLLTAWVNQNTTGGDLRMLSVRFHDAVNGIRLSAAAADTSLLLDPAYPQEVKQQDTITVALQGSAVAGDIINAHLLFYYDNLDSVNARFISPATLSAKKVNILGLPFAIAGAGTGLFPAGLALNAGTAGAILKANVDYALLGIGRCRETAAGNGSAVRIQGSDTGNVPIHIPLPLVGGNPQAPYFFSWLSERSGRPLIPVINAANAGNTIVSVMNNENADTVTFDLVLAELG